MTYEALTNVPTVTSVSDPFPDSFLDPCVAAAATDEMWACISEDFMGEEVEDWS